MDYSTISNKTNCTEVEEFTNGELSERYYQLKKQFDDISQSYETTKQKLHDVRLSHETAVEVITHLNLELESLQAEERKKKNEANDRIAVLQDEIIQLRAERTEMLDLHAAEIKKYVDEIRNLKEERAIRNRESPVKDSSELDDARAEAESALREAALAKAALEEAKQEVEGWRSRLEELMCEMAEMRQAADLRREEMQAAGEREMATLAELAEAKALLHQCTDSQDLQPHAAKGNSIFAEVEDKRQEMAKNLIQMKQTNSRLKRELANKTSELEALLHEKQTVWEQQAGATAHDDRELVESYEERITQLEAVCERQRRELSRWFAKLNESAANGWLPGVLNHLKSECEQLRVEVLSRGAAQLASAALIRDLRRKLAANAMSTAKLSVSPATKADADCIIEDTPVIFKTKNVDDVKKKVSFN